jgi:hypothetical protein
MSFSTSESGTFVPSPGVVVSYYQKVCLLHPPARWDGANAFFSPIPAENRGKLLRQSLPNCQRASYVGNPPSGRLLRRLLMYSTGIAFSVNRGPEFLFRPGGDTQRSIASPSSYLLWSPPSRTLGKNFSLAETPSPAGYSMRSSGMGQGQHRSPAALRPPTAFIVWIGPGFVQGRMGFRYRTLPPREIRLDVLSTADTSDGMSTAPSQVWFRATTTKGTFRP